MSILTPHFEDLIKMANGPDFDAADFGADHIAETGNDYGGTHYTAYSETGGQVSWDTDSSGGHVDGSEHMSDRNVGGGSGWSSWSKD